jgi:hypothetical protein
LSIASDQDELWVMFGIIFGVIVLIGIIRMGTQKKQKPPASASVIESQ